MMVSFKSIFVLFVLILAFTAIDYGFHYIGEKYGLESVQKPEYFTNKIIYGTIIGVGLLFLIGQMNLPQIKVLTWGLAILLQFRYYQIYSFTFNVIVVLAHWVILYYLLEKVDYFKQVWSG